MKKVLILLGPTGVGKTGLSLLIAKKFNTEIISADSMLVYRHMDIGTAKPSKEELETVPHHLINIRSPKEPFSAGVFRELSAPIIDALHAMNKIPVMVGGTGLYIRSLTRGLFEGPSADVSLREQLEGDEAKQGQGYLYNLLLELDPEAADGLEPNDRRRIIRALEVSLKEDQKISHMRKSSTIAANYEFIKIGLTRDRKELYHIIEKRVDGMMNSGLLTEVKDLMKMNPGITAMQAIGYKELGQYLQGEVDMPEAVRLIKKRTKMYAKRQYTWFNKEPDVCWVDISGLVEAEDIFRKVLKEVAILNNLN